MNQTVQGGNLPSFSRVHSDITMLADMGSIVQRDLGCIHFVRDKSSSRYNRWVAIVGRRRWREETYQGSSQPTPLLGITKETKRHYSTPPRKGGAPSKRTFVARGSQWGALVQAFTKQRRRMQASLFGRLAVQGPKRGGRPATSWVDCLQKNLEAFGAVPRKGKGRKWVAFGVVVKDGRDWMTAAKNMDKWHRGVERGAEALDSAWRRADLRQSNVQLQR